MSAANYNIKERIIISKKLSYLLRGGMSLVESITLIESDQKKSKARYFSRVRKDLINGKTLHQSIGDKNILFDQSSIHLIRIGEMTGTLPKSFEDIVSILEKRLALRSKIQSALIYPAIIITLAVVLIVVLLLYVFPQIISVFGSMNAKLPLITRIFMNSTSFLKKYGLNMCASFFLITVMIFLLFKKSMRFKIFFEWVLLIFSPIRKQFHSFFLKDYCAMFGLLLGSGMSIVEISSILETTTKSVLYKLSCQKLSKHLEKGQKTSLFFKKYPLLFPAFLSSLIHVGESTGNLSGTFIYMAKMYEESADESLQRMTALIEPLLMIFIGLFVGALALAIISPVYQLTSALSLK